MLPVSAREDSLQRLIALVRDYEPDELVVLGDVVHRAVPVAEIEREILEFWNTLSAITSVRLVAGNHDRNLDRLLNRIGIPAQVLHDLRVGRFMMVHGDDSLDRAAIHLREAEAQNGCVLIGHEHPAITISDGVATSIKCPCFAAGTRLVGLPAFTMWAAGGDVRRKRYLSAYFEISKPKAAFACMGRRILPVSL
jgi:putative SbcD/Mre11-related phosphoesterase